MSDELVPLRLEIPAGIVTSDSIHASEGHWVAMDKVRFHQGKPEKIGGWVAQNSVALSGSPRSMLAWRANDFTAYLAAGTHRNLYLLPQETFSVYDITPLRESGTLGSDPFTTTNLSTTVTVADTSHGLAVGDSVHFSGATAVAGITIDGEYLVVSVPNNNSYTITHSVAANASTSGGGAAVLYEYEIPIGKSFSEFGQGFGIETYGMGTYGTARSSPGTAILEARVWALTNFGQILLSTYNVGSLYDWDPSDPTPTSNRAALVTDAPTDIRSIFVTTERFVVALCEDRVVKWCDQGDYTTWTPAIDNVAGQRTITEGSKLIAGCTLSGGTNLIWTDLSCHVWQYIGGDFIWDNRLAGNNCGLIGPNAKISFAGHAYWMSRYGFFMFSGSLQPMPNSDSVHAFVVDQLDQLSAYLCVAMYNAKFHELWFFFANNSGAEPSLYAIVDLDDFVWSVGTLERVGGASFSDGETRPYWADSSGTIFLHEEGYNDDGAAIDAHVTMAPSTLDKGKSIMDIEGLEADFFEQNGTVDLEISTWDRFRKLTDPPLETVTKHVAESTTMLDLRLAGRYIGMTIRSNTLDGYFRFGAPAAYLKTTGVRR